MFRSDSGDHIRKILNIAIPVCLGQLGHVLVGVVDSMMVGNYGEAGSDIGALSLAAASLANGLFTVVLVFGIGLAYGVTPLVANTQGDGDSIRLTSLLRHSVLICGISGLILFGLLSGSSFLLKYFDQKEEVVALAIPYFNIMVFSMVPLMLFLSFKQFAEGLSHAKQAMYITLIANLVNVVLNYLLIYGKFGFPEMGLNGAGWGSFGARLFMLIMMILYFKKSKYFKEYLDGLKFKAISMDIIKRIMNIGIPIGLQWVFEVGAFAFAAVMMGWIGADQLAAHQVAISIASITYMLASGISSAATVRVGVEYGRKNMPELRNAGFSAFALGLVFMFMCAIVFILLRESLPLLFNKKEEVVEIASSLLLIAALFQLSDGTQVIGLGNLRGMSDVKVPTYITVIAYWVLALPIAYVLGFTFGLGAVGIWTGLLLGLSFSAIMLFIRFNIKSKQMPF